MNKELLLIILVNGLIWARSSLGKLSEGKFVDSLAATLTRFAEKNPYPLVKDFLNTIAIPNSKVIGNLTMWGEVVVGLTLTLPVALLFSKKPPSWVKPLVIVGLIGGMWLNLVFWFAAGYSSPSTDSLNLLMFLTQLIGLIYVLKLKLV